MNRQAPINRVSKGFTVVEVVVAFTLFAIVAISLVSITEFVQYSQRQSIYTNIANQAAQSKIAEYQSMGYDALTIGTSENFSSDSSLNGLPAGKTATIAVSQPSIVEKSKQLEVTISYPASSTTKTVKMKAYVTQNEGGA